MCCLTLLWCALTAAPAPAPGEVRLAVLADTNLSAYPSEQRCTYGARSAARVKGIEMFWLGRFDTAPLAGHRVTGARFVCRAVREQFRTLGFSTVAADWAEGDGQGDANRPGTCWLARGLPGGALAPWSETGVDFGDVAWTAGHTLVSYGEVTRHGDGWLSAPVAPRLLEACASGASAGLCVSDETGQTRANNDIYCREQSASAPYVLVTRTPATAATARVSQLVTEPLVATDGTVQGAAEVRFDLAAAADALPRLAIDAAVNGQPVPRWRLPQPVNGRNAFSIDGLAPGSAIVVEVRCGGSAQRTDGRAGEALAPATWPASATAPAAGADSPVYAVPGTCHVHPVTANVLEEVGEAAYAGPAKGTWRRANPVWDGHAVSLAGARGEAVCFQIVADGVMDQELPERHDLRGAGGVLPIEAVRVERLWLVHDPHPVAEIAVPWAAARRTSFPTVRGQRYWPVLVEIQIPRDAAPGDYLSAWAYGGRSLPIRLTVWPHTLPDELGFDVSLNSYGRVYEQYQVADGTSDAALAAENEVHRLAHRYRLTWAPLTYGQSGRVEWGAGPVVGEGERPSCDFATFDRRFGPLLSGDALAGLPRPGVPLRHIYLPFCEHWPTPMDQYAWRPTATGWPDLLIDHALHAPPIEQAFPASYQARFREVARLTAQHFQERGWSRTQAQCYLNDKYDYRDPKQGGRGTSWWLLDEPMHRDDWLALRFFGRLFKDGVAAVAVRNLVVRADISRPQWQRDWLDGSIDLAVVGRAYAVHQRRTRAWLDRERVTAWTYASAHRPGASNLNAVAWCLSAYLAGADGVVPWNSIGGEANYVTPADTALILPGRRFGLAGPVASVRLKALREGQQEVERLRLLAGKRGWSRGQMAAAVGARLDLRGQATGQGEEAGRLSFAGLDATKLARLRREVAAELEQ